MALPQARLLDGELGLNVSSLQRQASVNFSIQARMVLEDPSSTDKILQDWQSVLPATLQEWGVEQKDLQSFFENFRNDLLQNKEV